LGVWPKETNFGAIYKHVCNRGRRLFVSTRNWPFGDLKICAQAVMHMAVARPGSITRFLRRISPYLRF
jgi:hypothetical protein